MKNGPLNIKAKDIQRQWHLVDAEGKILGRIATEIALLLTGKAKTYFVRHLDCGDYVVVINTDKVKLTGNKFKEKVYTAYSGYPGGLRRQTFEELFKRKPEEVIRRAVYGMLPKNKLRAHFMKRLYVYIGQEHPYKNKFVTSEVKKK